jgi:predicted porin
MKKSLIAMAVLGAAAGAAQAQSSVTLYGVVDLWAGRESTTNAAGVKSNNTKLESGGLSGSRWGMKGSEDLGGGLKAVFTLENGFNADTGTAASSGNSFGRQAYLGLAGGFGTVTFGNVYSAMDDIAGASNSGFDSALSASNGVLAVNGGGLVAPGATTVSGNDLTVGYNGNPKNAFKYVSPSFGGFSGGFSYSLDEANGIKADQTDFSVSYAAGPIAVNFAYEVQGDLGAKFIGGSSEDLKITALNGSYDLGVAKLMASYGQVKMEDAKATDFQFGADIPLSSALTLSAGYAQSKDNDALGNQKRTGFGVAATYSLSKRTTAYTGFRTNKAKTGGTTDSKGNLIAVGLKHTF